MKSVAEKIRPDRMDHAVDIDGNYPYSRILFDVGRTVQAAHFSLLVELHNHLYGRHDNTVIWRWR